MKRSTLLMIVAIIIGIVLVIMDIPYRSLFLYFAIPATMIVNGVRMWEVKQAEKKTSN